MKTRFGANLARLFPTIARRFVRHRRGAAAVEAAMIMLPFIALLVMTMEMALVFFAQQTLENAAATAGRDIMTGQCNKTMDAASFKKEICARKLVLFNCAEDLHVDVQKFVSFGDVDPKVEFDDQGKPKTAFDPGVGDDIVVARLMYKWPIISPLSQEYLTGSSSTSRWLVATAAFRNEPYGKCT